MNELHEDGCLITIASNKGPGLEIRSPDVCFLPLEISSQQVIVMPGEILWLLSGGAIEPLFHRVRADRSNEERMSLLFFGHIDLVLPRFSCTAKNLSRQLWHRYR